MSAQEEIAHLRSALATCRQQFQLLSRLATVSSLSIPGQGRVPKWQAVQNECAAAAAFCEKALNEGNAK